MKILVTGAHFTPAQAVIEELKKWSDSKITYVGRKHTQEGDKTLSVESQVLPKLGVKFISLTAGRLRRNIDFWTLWSLLKIPIGFIQAPFILLREKPDIILSFGGYVSVPVVIWGWLLSIPIMVHEQTLISSLANTFSNFFADKICVSFDKDYDFDKEKIILTGNPIRKELLKESNNQPKQILELIKLSEKDKLPIIYITGGNQGSDIINRTILVSLKELTKVALVIHQTGDSKLGTFDKLLEEKNQLIFPGRYLVQKWFNVEEVKTIYENVSLVVTRSGMNTLYELAYFGIPTIVIPLPNLFKNEQLINAKYFKNIGLCEIILQNNLSPNILIKKIAEMLKNNKALKKSTEKAKKVIVPDAAARISQEVLVLLSQKNS